MSSIRNRRTSSEGEVKRSVGKQICLGLMANFSNLAPSSSLGFSAVVNPVLENLTNPYPLTKLQTSWFASIASLATPIGCFLSGPISDRFGRRSAILAVNIVCFIGWLIISTAFYFPEHQFPILIVGRIFTGLSTGLSSMPATVYMAEISSPTLRGVFTTWSSIFFSLGVLVVYILGYILKDAWGTIALITASFPCIGMFFAVFFIPESPSWLITKNRPEEAKRNMCKIFGVKDYIPEVQSEIESLIESKEKSVTVTETEKRAVFHHLKKKLAYLSEPVCLKPLFIIIMYFFFQQFSGCFAVVFYALDIVKEAGISFDPYLTIVLIALTRVVCAIFVSFISKKVGRRPLTIISCIGTALSMLGLATYVLLSKQNLISSETQQNLAILPVFCLISYFISATLGLLILPFAMAGEVFPIKVRGVASGITSCFGYIFSFVIVKFYSDMISGMTTYGVFYFYGTVAVVGAIFLGIFLPETKGKTLQEIENSFKTKKEAVEPLEQEC